MVIPTIFKAQGEKQNLNSPFVIYISEPLEERFGGHYSMYLGTCNILRRKCKKKPSLSVLKENFRATI